MYGILEPLTKENILKKANSYTIFKYYCKNFEQFGKLFKSPFRDEKKPSASIIFYKGDLLFKDFGESSYRAIDFVSRLYNISFFESLQKINADLNLGLGINSTRETNISVPIIPLPDSVKEEKHPTVLQVKRREWKEHDIKYWTNNYHISLQTLKKFTVSPISHFTIDDYLYIADKHSYNYNYYWESGVFRRKIYQPFSEFKWVSNGGKVVQGEGMLPKSGELLIITSSLKDVMVLYELGYIAIAPTSETSFVPSEYFLKQSLRFKKIVLFMDSDTAGMMANRRMSERWNIPYIFIPDIKKGKDISDYVKNNSLNNGKELMESLITNINL